jgi:hypothetical protein
MMHGHEKSDSAIVAVKRTNKALHSAAEQSTAELFAAEPVEPRAEHWTRDYRDGGKKVQATSGSASQVSPTYLAELLDPFDLRRFLEGDVQGGERTTPVPRCRSGGHQITHSRGRTLINACATAAVSA